ncbi:MAG: aminomethyl-transferring glycine dehydrogenase [Ignavibacteriales bacterium]|nr:aminomethyl-transferring glycine dehydrogenase [Ignavibacteriales bacterium]
MKQLLFDDADFVSRHIGPRDADVESMLRTIGTGSLDQLIDETIPQTIRLTSEPGIAAPVSEFAFIDTLRTLARKNKVLKSYLGQGYYGCITPAVIQRNIFENAGWYTQYTPYQPEISQGRLEALLNFQSMVMDMTGMEVANASLLDEGTAAAEAMAMLFGIVNKKTNGSPACKFFVSDECFAQTLAVIKTRASAVGIEVVVGDFRKAALDASYFAAIVQYPTQDGAAYDYREFIQAAHASGVLVVVASDLMSLALLTPPGECGADVVVGNSQRFGVPLGYGGPHAGFFATKNEYIRTMPGRIIGVSVDAQNNRAYRMTLQTREQHIRREKATSNICTAQALLAIMAGMYAVYHGPEGIRRIATRIRAYAEVLEQELQTLGFAQLNEEYFDTLKFAAPDAVTATKVHQEAVKAGYNFRVIDPLHIGISIDETTNDRDIESVLGIFAQAKGVNPQPLNVKQKYGSMVVDLADPFKRKSPYLQHPVFNSYHSETEMMRYIKGLENRDLSLAYSMIPLGSCTMKLNAATELMPVSWPEFAQLHPFAPIEQAEGYRQVFSDLEKDLCTMTGLAAASLQPNSGAQGEFSGLMVIRAFHQDRGQGHRNVALIPSSAHGTNPASAVMAGFKVVVVGCDDQGNIDLGDLRAKATAHKESLGALLVTYPSTHGVFEEEIKQICAIVHENGGQVYMDGANLNAQVGLTSPGVIGADVCHINLHKTFGIPHGGGGPGMGPICVAQHLAPFLPGHPVVKVGGSKAIHAVSSAPWGSPSILLISYAYIKMLGPKGVTAATKFAILNANYLKARLQEHYAVLYQGKNGRVGHEFILNMKQFKEQAGVEVEDIAKRLMDYGFHAPTVSFPVHDTLMIEPTESESKAELDRFAEALISIRKEIQEVIDGNADRSDNVLKNAPHTAAVVVSDQWTHAYPRTKAAFPLSYLVGRKFWPAVGRINNTYGDRNIICSCPPIQEYAEAGE